MAEAVTKFVRYVYLDVVGFTQNRSVEAQTEIVDALNQVVRESLAELGIGTDHVVLLPTGDGMGIALLDESLPYDIHFKLALALLRAVHQNNERTTDPMRQFKIRIGVNQNVDNIIVDINGAQNVAGAGINMAQRVMSVADGSQLLIGQTVFDTLVHRERYMECFRRFDAVVKRDLEIAVYQFIEPGHDGLSIEVPAQFKRPEPTVQRLALVEAYYLAHALKNREFLIRNSRHGQNNYVITLVLWFLALDSVERVKTPDYAEPMIRIHGGGRLSLQDTFSYYMSSDFWVCLKLAGFIKRALASIRPYIEDSGTQYYIVNDPGRNKLKAEYPDIWERFELEGTV